MLSKYTKLIYKVIFITWGVYRVILASDDIFITCGVYRVVLASDDIFNPKTFLIYHSTKTSLKQRQQHYGATMPSHSFAPHALLTFIAILSISFLVFQAVAFRKFSQCYSSHSHVGYISRHLINRTNRHSVY